MESDYLLFGLRVRSEISLPELTPAKGEGVADVIVERGPVAGTGEDGEIRAEGGLLIVNVPNVARYSIEGGERIVVDAKPDVPERNLRLFLLGSAFGGLLHQRGLLPLHANAIEVNGRAIAFMGASGSGKSTLAAWFHDRGHRIIADDVCVIRFDGAGTPMALPGLPRLRLWAQALEASGRDPSGLQRSYVDSAGEMDKFDVPIMPDASVQTEVPLAALYLLDQAADFSIRELRGIEAAEAVFANTYRGAYISKANTHEAHWASVVRLVRALPVYVASREWDFAKIDDQCRRLMEHAFSASATNKAVRAE